MFADAFRNRANGRADCFCPQWKGPSGLLYWVMSGNDFTLDINDPEHPKIVCIGNNPQWQGIYGVALLLYNARLITLTNNKNKQYAPRVLCKRRSYIKLP
jgi:hypothetical protein